METVTNLCNVTHQNSNKQKNRMKTTVKPFISSEGSKHHRHTKSIKVIFVYSKPRHSASLHLLILALSWFWFHEQCHVSACRLNLSINSSICRLVNSDFYFHLTPLIPTQYQDTNRVSVEKGFSKPFSLYSNILSLWDFQWELAPACFNWTHKFGHDFRFIEVILSISPGIGFRQMD